MSFHAPLLAFGNIPFFDRHVTFTFVKIPLQTKVLQEFAYATIIRRYSRYKSWSELHHTLFLKVCIGDPTSDKVLVGKNVR